MTNKVIFLKNIRIDNTHAYRINEVISDRDVWVEAIPEQDGYKRVAENEKFLKILLENDAKCAALLKAKGMQR